MVVRRSSRRSLRRTGGGNENDRMIERCNITLTVNGTPVSAWVEPRRTLADFLRDDLGLTGTHLGCEHGVCGACTVRVGGRAVRACLTLAVQVAGKRVETVEGLAQDGTLSTLQQAFRRHHALQCGFCTPGILMSLSELLDSGAHLDENSIRELLSGHLCRCTGYGNIVRAALDALAESRKGEAILDD